ncbi:hypothetical protein DH2020_010300 [Rehmannia glutinosa]|uniref:CCHC-type domain-containing protein n=1 Tax=Rehmannia glutinosa TaxID=99300 RepID=A0ABR0XA96_REHGL
MTRGGFSLVIWFSHLVALLLRTVKVDLNHCGGAGNMLKSTVLSLLLRLAGPLVVLSPAPSVVIRVYKQAAVMEEVVGKWRKLSITETEEEEIGIGDSLVEEGRKLIHRGLIGRLLTRRPYNKKQFMDTITRLWRVEGGFKITEIGLDTFFFIIEDPREVDRILNLEPWTFNRLLIILKEFEGLNVREVGELTHTRFWVQIHNLPDEGMYDKIGMVIGDGLGIALEVDADDKGRCLGHYMRVRVLMDITKPLRRGAPIRLGSNGNRVWVDFKYERIPDFCFACGIVGHGLTDCKLEGVNVGSTDTNNLPYGRWLKGELVVRSFQLSTTNGIKGSPATPSSSAFDTSSESSHTYRESKDTGRNSSPENLPPAGTYGVAQSSQVVSMKEPIRSPAGVALSPVRDTIRAAISRTSTNNYRSSPVAKEYSRRLCKRGCRVGAFHCPHL